MRTSYCLWGRAERKDTTILLSPGLDLTWPPHHKRKNVDPSKVAIVQGSGSGHEPAHVMAVGPGMLTAACQGPVFAAPPVDACYETIKSVATDAPRCPVRSRHFKWQQRSFLTQWSGSRTIW